MEVVVSLLSNAFKRLYDIKSSRSSKRNSSSGRWHKCRIEHMEPRQLLSATPQLNLGAVFVELGKGDDTTGDAFEVTFNQGSGVSGSAKLTDLTINLRTDSSADKYCFFDTQSGGKGVFGSSPFTLVGSNTVGLDTSNIQVSDGGTTLTLHFSNFQAGEKLIFTIDVDEQDGSDVTALAEGSEFARQASIKANFDADYYVAAVTAPIAFVDYYTDPNTTNPLGLPDDKYLNDKISGITDTGEIGDVDTAGAFGSVTLTPKPVSIAGNVYLLSDPNNLNSIIKNLGGFTLSLYYSSDGGATYGTSPIATTVSGSDGSYSFTLDGNGNNLLPGKYKVVETESPDYLAVAALQGSVGGVSDGTVVNQDIISDVSLLGGQNSVKNNFYEKLGSISGHVYYDADGSSTYNSGDSLITESTTITLYDSNNNVVGTYATLDGNFSFTGLKPDDNYSLSASRPSGPIVYLQGTDNPGSVGGTALNDYITAIPLGKGVDATDYNFGEILPAVISGKVYVSNNNNQYDAGETLLSGVTVALYDYNNAGNPIATTTTDGNGNYKFTINYLNPARTDIQIVDGNGNTTYYSNTASESPIVFKVVESEDGAKTNVFGASVQYILKNNEYYYDPNQPPDNSNLTSGAYNGVDEIDSIALGFGDQRTQNDFYEIQYASISGYVFQDGSTMSVKDTSVTPDLKTLNDAGYTGTLTPNDTRFPNIKLELCDASGYSLGVTTLTQSPDGHYSFGDLPPGTYVVKMAGLPDGYITGIDTAGAVKNTTTGVVVNKYSGVTDSDLVQKMGIYGVTTSGNSIVEIALGAGDAGTQYNFSVVKLQSTPDGPPVYPNPVPPISLPPRAPIMPDGLRYGVSYVLPPISMPPQFGGGSGGPPGYTWHLSVIDGGPPRQLENGEFAADGETQLFDPVTWTGADLNQGGVWIIADANGVPVKQYHFGLSGATPVTGDWNGDGVTKIGLFIDGLWFLDLDGNGIWDENDLRARLGKTGDKSVTGDWDGDGKTDIGIFGPSWFGDPKAILADPGLPDVHNPIRNGYKNMPPDPENAAIGYRTMKRTSAGRLRSDLIDHVFHFGTEADVPVVGDWNGDGVYTVAIFRNGTWFLDMNGDGRWGPGDAVVQFGQEGDIPVVGDWTGDGTTKLGV